VTEWVTELDKYKRSVKLERKDIKPIMIIRSPRENPEIEENFAKLNHIDQLWIKHFPIIQANEQLLTWVKEHKDEYTHVIMTTDDVTFTKEDVERLMDDLTVWDFPILTGVCNFCTIWCGKKNGVCEICEENRPHEYLAATFNPLHDILIKDEYLHNTRTPALGRATYDFIPDQWRQDNPIIKQIYFHGIALTAIRMDIFLQMDGLHLYNKEHGISADDVNLAIYCYRHKIPQFADFRVFVRHYGGSKIYPNINVKEGSKVVFNGKSLPSKLDSNSEEALKLEYDLLMATLAKNILTIPQRPSIPFYEIVFDNLTNKQLTQADWDERYGKYRKFMRN